MEQLKLGYLDNSEKHNISTKDLNLNCKNEYAMLLNLILDNMVQYIIPKADKIYFNLHAFEKLLRDKGYCAVYMLDNNVICSECNFVGDINAYGVGNDCIAITKNGIETKFENFLLNEKIVIAKNNTDYIPDTIQYKAATILAESDISLKSDLVGTRYNKIINVKNDKEKMLYTKAIEANKDGVPQVVVGDLSIRDILDNVSDNIIYDLTSIKDSDKIQYISKLKDEELRQFLLYYGLMTQGSTKMAQQSADEILSYLPFSMVIPLDRLNSRKDAINEINLKFNKKWGVEFKEPWKMMYDRLIYGNFEDQFKLMEERIKYEKNIEGDNNNENV